MAEPVRDNEPRVSVIMAAYGAAETIEMSLNSLTAQTADRYEIVLVCDASDDALCVLASQVLMTSDVPFSIACHRERSGAASARNLAASLSRGEILVFADSDDESLSDRIKLHDDMFERYPEVGATVVEQERHYSDSFVVYPKSHEQLLLKSPYLYARFLLLGDSGGVDRELLSLPASSMAVRRNVFNELRGFDESLDRLEDVDLCLRMLLAGNEILKTSTPGVRRSLVTSGDSKIHRNAKAEKQLVDRYAFLLSGLRETSVAQLKVKIRYEFFRKRPFRLFAALVANLALSPRRQSRLVLESMRYRIRQRNGISGKLIRSNHAKLKPLG